MGAGAFTGWTIGIGLGIAAANVLGFPEVEVGEGVAALTVAGRAVQGEIMILGAASVDNVTAPLSLSLLTSGVTGTIGGAVGFAATTPTCQ